MMNEKNFIFPPLTKQSTLVSSLNLFFYFFGYQILDVHAVFLNAFARNEVTLLMIAWNFYVYTLETRAGMNS